MIDTEASVSSGSGQGDVDLGVRLKAVREHNGLSQRELAKRAGVPHSSISMIEQGLSSPSVNSLARILTGIPMSLGYFFTCDLGLLNRSVYRADELAGQEQGVAPGIYQQIVPSQATQSLRFLRICYKPGADSGAQPLRLPQASSGYLIQGELELTLNAEVSRLHAGDVFSLAALQAHRLRNISASQDCVFLSCLAD